MGEVGLSPSDTVLDGDPAPISERGRSPPIFRPVSIVAKQLGGSRCHLVGRQASAKATLCYWGPSSPSPKRKQNPPIFGRVYCGQTAGWIKMPLGRESSTSIASGILIHPAVWPFGHNGHGPKIGACAPLLGELGSHLRMWPAPRLSVYHHAKFHVDPSNRLATIHQRHRQNRQTDRTDTTVCGLGRGLLSCQVAS